MALIGGLVSWQECLQCGGCFLVWADPDRKLYPLEVLKASMFLERDGTPIQAGIQVTCSSCGVGDPGALATQQRRWGISGMTCPPYGDPLYERWAMPSGPVDQTRNPESRR